MALYTLRGSDGYVIAEADDLEQAVAEYDDRKDDKPHFDDFGITELRERLTAQRKAAREREKQAK
jgi:hypothetical protein